MACGAFLITLPVLAETTAWQMLAHDTVGGELVRDFGFALFIAGSAGVGYELLMRNAFEAEVEHTLTRIINERSAELDKLRQAGVKTVHRRLAHARLIDNFEEAKESIRILQTWSGDFNNIGDTLVWAAKKGCEVKILLLNPDSDQAKQRGQDLGYVNSTVVQALIQNDLEVLRKCALSCNNEERNRIKVRLYDSTPVIAIYGYDDINVVGTYWRQRHSQEGPQLEVDTSKVHPDHPSSSWYVADAVVEHFDDIWNDERTIEWGWEGPVNSSQKHEQRPQAASMISKRLAKAKRKVYIMGWLRRYTA
jgi:hypothetical protein